MNRRDKLYPLIGVAVVAVPILAFMILASLRSDDQGGPPPSHSQNEEVQEANTDQQDDEATASQREQAADESDADARTDPSSSDDSGRQELIQRVVGFAAAWWAEHPEDEPLVSRKSRIEPYSTSKLLDQYYELEEERLERGLFYPEYRQPRAHEASVYDDIDMKEVDGGKLVTIKLPVVENPDTEPIVFRPSLTMRWVERDERWYVDEILDASPFL